MISDMTYDESKQSDTEMVISYLPKTQQIDFVLLRSFKVSPKDYQRLLDLTLKECQSVYKLIRNSVIDSSFKRIICSK